MIDRSMIDAPPVRLSDGIELGRSRENRPIYGFRTGNPAGRRVSIIAGAHADEPVGPELARRLVNAMPLDGRGTNRRMPCERM